MKNAEINALSDEALEELIKKDQCPYEPEQDLNKPLGMLHCPICNEMVLAGLPHPRHYEFSVEDQSCPPPKTASTPSPSGPDNSSSPRTTPDSSSTT